METPNENTDIELFKEDERDAYSPSLHKTKEGNIGINAGGTVYVKSLREWHELARAKDDSPRFSVSLVYQDLKTSMLRTLVLNAKDEANALVETMNFFKKEAQGKGLILTSVTEL